MDRPSLNTGYMYSFSQPDRDISIPKGQAVSGHSIGILVLDLGYPLLPGNVANASTFSFPVRYRILKGTTTWQIISHDPALLEMILEGGRELEKDGVRAIVGACGYFGYYQKQTVSQLNVPVFLSSLLQLSMIRQSLKPGLKIGVLCADQKGLSGEVLQACGIEDISDLIIAGVQYLPEFKNILYCTGHFNPAALERELVEFAKNLALEHPDIGALLLECSDMPPFSWSIQRATGLPVFDFITMINWIHSAMVQRPYCGFM
ncbi:MAG: aspartate/glutamate racemase family protein [Phycisphaerae bacterium]